MVNEISALEARGRDIQYQLNNPSTPMAYRQNMQQEFGNIVNRVNYLKTMLSNYNKPMQQNYGYGYNQGYGNGYPQNYAQPQQQPYPGYYNQPMGYAQPRPMTPTELGKGLSEVNTGNSYTSKYDPEPVRPVQQQQTRSMESRPAVADGFSRPSTLEGLKELQNEEKEIMSGLEKSGVVKYSSVSNGFIIGGSGSNIAQQVTIVDRGVPVSSLNVKPGYIQPEIKYEIYPCNVPEVTDDDIVSNLNYVADHDITSTCSSVGHIIEKDLSDLDSKSCIILDFKGDIGNIYPIHFKNSPEFLTRVKDMDSEEARVESKKFILSKKQEIEKGLEELSSSRDAVELSMRLESLIDERKPELKKVWEVIRSFLLTEYNNLVRDRAGHNQDVITTFDDKSVQIIDQICSGYIKEYNLPQDFIDRYNEAVNLLISSIRNTFGVIKGEVFKDCYTIYLIKKFKSFKCIINSDFVRELMLSTNRASFVAEESYPELFRILKQVEDKESFKSSVLFTDESGVLEVVLDVYKIPSKNLYMVSKVYTKA